VAVERLEGTRTRSGCIWCFRSGCVLALGCIWMHWMHWMVGHMHVLGHQLCYSIYRVDGSHKWRFVTDILLTLLRKDATKVLQTLQFLI
jgi:hypothetical protein